MNSRPETTAGIATLAWPLDRLGDAIHAVVEACGQQSRMAPLTLSEVAAGSDLNQRIERLATAHGVESDRIYASLKDLPSLLTGGGPLIVHLPSEGQTDDDEALLLVAGGDGRRLTVIDRGHRLRQIQTADVVQRLARPFEDNVRPRAERAIADLHLPGSALRRLIDDQLDDVRFRGCWLLRLPPGAPVAASLKESRAPLHILFFAIAYVLQYGLFVGSWWLLGSSLLYGTIERAWVVSWALLLVTLIAFRLTATWQQGRAATLLGAWLRRRLLRGALNVDRQFIRRKGVGQLFGFVVESAAIESLALSGGLASACALVELVAAGLIMWTALGYLLPLTLFGWIGVAAVTIGVYAVRRERWTGQRIQLSERLLEAMVGHRTRSVQHEPNERKAEDLAIDGYLRQSQAMDSAGFWLTSILPRGWMVLALAALTPALTADANTTTLAAGLGGVVLAFRGLQRLAGGAASFAGAVIAARRVGSLSRAAEQLEPPAIGATMARADSMTVGEGATDAVAHVRDITFRYQAHGDAVLRGTSLSLERGARVLLEGSSGSGKTTLGAIIAGLTKPDSGSTLR